MITTLAHQQRCEPQHVSAEQYARFARGYYEADSANNFLYARADFVACYPNLSDWLQLPLAERVGRAFRESTKTLTNRVSYRARSYLYYLVTRDRLHLDWE